MLTFLLCMLNETAGSYWAYWSSPDAITAYSTILLVLANIALVAVTWKYVREVKGQAGFLTEQANALKRQADANEAESKFVNDQSGVLIKQANTMENQFEIIRDESATMKRQADAMEKQSDTMLEQTCALKGQAEAMQKQLDIMLDNMEYDRLIKKYERVNKEMTLFIGLLYGRRNDPSIFSLRKLRPKVITHSRGTVLNQENYDFVSFWDSVEQNMFLNRSSEMKSALEKYKSNIWDYFELEGKPQNVERQTMLKNEFDVVNKPRLIEQIELRYNALIDELTEIEEKSKILENK